MVRNFKSLVSHKLVSGTIFSSLRCNGEWRSEDNNAGRANRKGRMMKTAANVPAFDLQVQKTWPSFRGARGAGRPRFHPFLSLSLVRSGATVSPCRVCFRVWKPPCPSSSACHDPPHITYKPRTAIGAEFIPPLLLPRNSNVGLIEFQTIFFTYYIYPWNAYIIFLRLKKTWYLSRFENRCSSLGTDKKLNCFCVQ